MTKEVFYALFEEGGFVVKEDNKKFLLYEIPQYGGEESLINTYDSLDNAINYGNSFT